MSDHWTDRLSDYIDDELPPHDRAALEAHLSGCDDCRTLVADLRAVVARAAALAPAEPSTDLWPAIRDRIGGDVRVIPLAKPAPVRARRLTLSIPHLAAAAAIVAFLSGGAVWLALRGPTTQAEPAFAVDVVAGEGAPSTTVSFAGTREYDAAIAQLERDLADARARLDPATVAVVEHNLDVIDSAIAEARSALADDPANPYLNRHLDNTLMTKIEVLRRVTGLGRGRT
jgi:anti-sigma factor RsiW